MLRLRGWTYSGVCEVSTFSGRLFRPRQQSAAGAHGGWLESDAEHQSMLCFDWHADVANCLCRRMALEGSAL